MTNDSENLDSTNETETTENQETEAQETQEETSQEETQETSDEAVEDSKVKELEAKVAKLEKENTTLAVQRDKAKKKAANPEPKTSNELSQMDLLAIMRNNVHEEDVSEIVDYAKLKKITVAEAIKTPFIKNLMDNNTENRRTAVATNTGPSRKGGGQLSDSALLNKANTSNEALTDEEISRLYILRKKQQS